MVAKITIARYRCGEEMLTETGEDVLGVFADNATDVVAPVNALVIATRENVGINNR